MKEEYL